jgi:hypothetical protein
LIGPSSFPYDIMPWILILRTAKPKESVSMACRRCAGCEPAHGPGGNALAPRIGKEDAVFVNRILSPDNHPRWN